MHFLDIWIKSYGCLKFQGEVWAGWACATANEKELTNCTKSRGQEEKKIQEKWVQPNRLRRRPAVARRLRVEALIVPSFLKKNYLKKKDSWKFGKWARAFGRMGVQYPHFLKLALPLGSANSSKIHRERRFHFFPKNKFLNLVYTWTFISTVGIFVS
jgi:hypothetical protein